MNIKILGPGCANCQTLERNVHDAAKGLNIEAYITRVEDIMDIMKYNVLSTPGIVIDEKLVSSGRVLTVKQLREMLTKYQ